jgi:hypothetical protein
MTFTKTNHKNKTMDRHAVSKHMDALAENARMFMAVTAGEARKKVAEARQRLYSEPETTAKPSAKIPALPSVSRWVCALRHADSHRVCVSAKP